MSACYISDLIFYPVKSLKGISLDEALIDDFGILHDRRFMFIDEKDKFITQRTRPELALLTVSLLINTKQLSGLQISSDLFGSIEFNMEEFSLNNAQKVNVSVWGDCVEALVIDNKNTRIISEYTGQHVRLAYMPSSSFRQIDREFFSEDKRVSFADGYPFLLISQESVADLNSRLKKSVSVENFRPNIVISGGISAYAEDEFKRMIVGDMMFEFVKPCSRCIMTTVDELGQKSADKEPLKTLSTYRKNNVGICFGQNLVHLNQGTLRKGDLVYFE